ncbi:guanylate kinase [Pauljensenia sp. UMB6358]|uniref:guanylate kinase n=1 Tax=Pauljensenia sp. UMB6358 TaxID=3046335 RepID=UPI00254A72E8|nr:guanylate kinase [Pauljensenia sp. UMB6358]MDK7121740.1 guanylate kinase [Pauljensenia sp. UMB6358]
MDKPRLTVLAGPTAVGKGTIVQALRERHPELVVSVSATTRSPRPGEVDGVHYLFKTDEEFDALVESGLMLEWATVHGVHRYGTPAPPVDEALKAGKSVLLEIDLDGARQVMKTRPDALFVFLAPPSWDELVRRLVGRGTEDEEERVRRLQTAKVEMAAETEFNVTVTNDDLDDTVTELAHLMGLE